MPWQLIGTLVPGYRWQQFDTPVIGGELFRVSQTWNGQYPGDGPAWFSSVFANSGISGFRRFYSNNEPLLMEMPIPDEFVDAGLLVRYIQVKLGIRTRLYADADYQVTLEVWTDSTDGSGQPAQLVSGGTYDTP